MAEKRLGATLGQSTPNPPSVYLIPCSCGTTFAVSPQYDQQGSSFSRFLRCPQCGKAHDPRNRLLHLGYQAEGFWTVEKC